MATRCPELSGDFGLVAATHWQAAAAGMAMLELGGNAFDAAAAAGFVLQVVEPHLNGLGGEAPILACPAGASAPEVVFGQGPAPAAATIEHFTRLGLDAVPGTGQLAACVPGALDAWLTLLARHGTLELATVLGPAIGYAERGHALLPRAAAAIESVAAVFREDWPSSAAIYLPGGSVPAAGARLANPDLARTYRRLAEAANAAGDREAGLEAARDAFYRGFAAEAIEAFQRQEIRDVTGGRHAGLLRADDLAAWSTPIEVPVSTSFAGVEVFKTDCPGQGPVFCQQLGLLAAAGYDPERGADTDGLESDAAVHTVIECAKLAFADREAYYGDPDQVSVPLAALLDPAYAADRVGLLSDRAEPTLRPGRPGGLVPRLPRRAADGGPAGSPVGVGEPGAALDLLAGEPVIDTSGVTRGDTCHVDVVDRWGNMVSATPSGGWLQSAPVVPGLGFCLGTRAQMFWLEPGLASSLAPGRRPRTTLSPSLAFRDGRPWLAFGTPGGDQQDQWSLLLFLRLVAPAKRRRGLQDAIEAPAFHSLHMPSSFWPRQREPLGVVMESRWPGRTVAALRARGHDVQLTGAWSLGRLTAVSRDRDGTLRGAACPRSGSAYVAGR